ncbi:hypothetical protein LOTGIDRAFT_228261 [Lottia gigantea]|uniref:Nuclear pore complex protein Nup160 n=1 Tax=Lottia gigantea TaxID=225164 RepID=V4ARZ2_LOTGI|nr:hypothetical protein LOTGIDRAFT_228261 [Lottia gigantea]ESO97630.1 hypothetical protein LOTGIDRAFT_228261 [Lottia gigantea]
MAEKISSLFKEISLSKPNLTRWKEISVNTGASTNTLQDIKVSESCGGYAYEESGESDSPVRNRYIYWRSYNDVLELVEDSLDLNLCGNYIRYRFQSTPILDGLTVHEVDDHVVILVATVSSVHRLVFPHPDCRQEASYKSEARTPSIFYDVSYVNTTDSRNMFLINPSSTITTHLTTAATYLDSSGDALFCLSADTGGTILVRMPQPGSQDTVSQNDLYQSSMMKKLWSGWVPTMIRGKQISPETPYDMVIHTLKGEAQIYTICHDHHLRMWSTKTRECVLARNLLDWVPSASQPTITIGSSGHKIKSFFSVNVTSMRLCVHLNFNDKNCFVLVEPTFENGRFHFTHLTTVFAPHEDLVDYSITSDTLFTLWTSSSGESTGRVYQLSGDTEQWIDVILDQPESTDVCLPHHIDPRDFFLQKIFHPGHFTVKHILKALNVYRRSVDSHIQADSAINISDLKEEVTNAIETEIRNCAMDYEIQEDDYCQIQLEQWSKFYSCCLQYKEVGCKMKGLFSDNVTGLVGLIKKESLSFLRPCDRLEEVVYLSDQQLPHLDLDVQNEEEAFSLHQDIKRLCDCISKVNQDISSEHSVQFHSQLLLLSSPQELAHHLVDILYFTDGVSTTNCQLLGLRIQEIKNLNIAMETLIRLLDLNQAETDGHILMEESGIDGRKQAICGRLFCSQTGTAVLLKCLQQFSSNRLIFCRNFILLADLLIKLSQQHLYGVDFDTSMNIRTNLLPGLTTLIRNYLVLNEFSHVVATPTPNTTLEFNLRQLSVLEISDTTRLNTNRGSLYSTLLEIFLNGTGGSYSRTLLAQSYLVNVETSSIWLDLLLPLSNILARILWPMSEEFVFPEFLIGSCQYLWLQEYIRQTDTWCSKNISARQFLLGLTYLHFDEPYKASECFVRAGQDVANDDFLCQKLIKIEGDEENNSSIEVLYYLKVIRQFEEFGLYDLVIYLADLAITVAKDNDPNVPTLWSKKFKYHLELNHNEEAYNAMIGNPEPSRRKDCLRQLLIVLCERGELKTLVDFPFIDLNEEVVNILESRARSVDLTTHNYYNLLYSFHVDRNNYRKAGCIMYEYGMRLGREVPGLKGLQRQAQCYLATLNALRLGKPEYAWIVKPVTHSKNDTSEMLSVNKHDLEGEEKNHKVEKKVEILEVEDIEREYMLIDARLRLIRKTEDPTLMSGPTPRAEEMVGHLVNSGFFDRAIIVCRRFDLPLNSVFENLALRCVNLSQSSLNIEQDVTSEAWDWLKENYSVSGAPTREASCVDQAWWLLQYYIECYECKNGKYHRCIAERLLSHGFSLPTWFLNSYRSINASELLRLYINYDLLEDAGDLVLEYVEAMLESLSGSTSNRYNIKGCVHPHTGIVWLPYTSIDQLLVALQPQQNHTHKKLYQDLKERMDYYMCKISNLSKEIESF